MNIKLLKTELVGANLFHNNIISLDMTTNKKVLKEDVEENVVQHLFSSVYKQNLISLVGINASGKTATLKYLSVVLNLFIKNRTLSFNEEHFPEVFESFEDKCKIINHFYSEKEHAIYELTSIIERNNGQFIFTEEVLKVKKASSNISKKQVFDFANEEPQLVRSRIKNFAKELLRDDSSIFMIVLNNNEISYKKDYFYDLLDFTNINTIVGSLQTIPQELIQYFDPNIERIEFLQVHSKYSSDNPVKIKFYGQEELEVTNFDLGRYLSSGTIKGLNLLIVLEKILLSGGYAIIDEIENHLNKNIVITILNLFKSKLNLNNATLIFTTHYSEILDDIERSDSIYYTTKKEGKIKLENLAYDVNRSDKKKSSVFLSGVLGTAPTYSSYMKFKKYLKSQLQMESELDLEKKEPSSKNNFRVIEYHHLMEFEEGAKDE